MDIESPYEVHDYIKSYVGEEKAQKRWVQNDLEENNSLPNFSFSFAVEYLERRSRWKRSLKGGAAYEDDLTPPAHALTPGAEEEFKEVGTYKKISQLCIFIFLPFRRAEKKARKLERTRGLPR